MVRVIWIIRLLPTTRSLEMRRMLVALTGSSKAGWGGIGVSGRIGV